MIVNEMSCVFCWNRLRMLCEVNVQSGMGRRARTSVFGRTCPEPLAVRGCSPSCPRCAQSHTGQLDTDPRRGLQSGQKLRVARKSSLIQSWALKLGEGKGHQVAGVGEARVA